MESKSIKILNNTKRYGYYAIKDIPADTIILIENAAVHLYNTRKYHRMLQIIYKIVFESSNKIKEKFMNLLPSEIKNSNFLNYDVLRNDIMCIKDEEIKNKLLSINTKDLLLYSMKYASNAFGTDEPLLLFKGAMFNHSCIPNVKFIQDKNTMYFVTLRNIKLGEELFIYYGTMKISKKEQQKKLLNQYGFKCHCEKCSNSISNSNHIKTY